MSSLEVLAQLQDLDVRLDQLQHRLDTLPELAERVELEAALAVLDQQRGVIETEVQALQREQKRHEDEVAAVEEKIQKSDDALYGGAITSPKEATAMQEEIASLGRRKNGIEEEILLLMEQIEPLDTDLAALAEQRSQIEQQLAVVDSRIAVVTEEVEAERTATSDRRAQLVEATSDELMVMYDNQRDNMRGRIAVGRLTGATCGACHLDLSAVDLDRIRGLPSDQPGECPECGALLVH